MTLVKRLQAYEAISLSLSAEQTKRNKLKRGTTVASLLQHSRSSGLSSEEESSNSGVDVRLELGLHMLRNSPLLQHSDVVASD